MNFLNQTLNSICSVLSTWWPKPYDLPLLLVIFVSVTVFVLFLLGLRLGYVLGHRRGMKDGVLSLDRDRPESVKTLKHNIKVKVVRVIDGDTFEAHPWRKPQVIFKVRILGLDTPECKRNAKARLDAKREGTSLTQQIVLGKAASEVARALLEGTYVRLESSAPGVRIKRDNYGRFLAYVRMSWWRDFGAELIQRGHADCLGWKYDHPRKAKYAKLKPSTRTLRRIHEKIWRMSK